MYSNEDLERFYVDYQGEWVPRGMTLRAYCDKNNVPYKVMENFVNGIRKKIVEVEVVGRPSGASSDEGRQPQAPSAPPKASPSAKGESGRISVFVRFGDGTEVSRRGLDYVGLKVLVEKLEVLC